MTKNVFGIIMFVAGATVGVAATYKFFKYKYDKKSKEEIEEIREYYTSKNVKQVETAEESSNESLNELEPLCGQDENVTQKQKEELEAYKQMIVNDCGYAVKDDGATEIIKKSKCKEPVEVNDENNTVLIKPDDFGEMDEETGEEYDKTTLVYYADGVVTYWEDDRTVDDVVDLLGTEFKDHFGDYGEEDAVYVRNIRNHTDYEVIRDGDKYYDFHTEKRGGEDE